MLFESRLNSYCALYELLSTFIKIVEYGKLSENGELDKTICKDDIVKFLIELEKWDSKYAIFLTYYTTGVCESLRKDFYELVSMSDEEIQLEFMSLERKRFYLKNLGGLEAAIKNEIGIFAIKPFPANTDFKPISTYEEARAVAVDAKARQNLEVSPKPINQ